MDILPTNYNGEVTVSLYAFQVLSRHTILLCLVEHSWMLYLFKCLAHIYPSADHGALSADHYTPATAMWCAKHLCSWTLMKTVLGDCKDAIALDKSDQPAFDNCLYDFWYHMMGIRDMGLSILKPDFTNWRYNTRTLNRVDELFPTVHNVRCLGVTIDVDFETGFYQLKIQYKNSKPCGRAVSHCAQCTMSRCYHRCRFWNRILPIEDTIQELYTVGMTCFPLCTMYDV